MTRRRLTMMVAGGVAALAGVWATGSLKAQQPGFKRVELQKHDLGVPGREAAQVRAGLAPGGGGTFFKPGRHRTRSNCWSADYGPGSPSVHPIRSNQVRGLATSCRCPYEVSKSTASASTGRPARAAWIIVFPST